MVYPTKYHNPRGQQIGCCICARKFSSSRYIKYNSKFSEALFCTVFQLKSMAGRRGYLCNPCVLVMKRYQKKLEKGIPPTALPNYSPRVDSCLKRGSKRQRCTQDRNIIDDADDGDGGVDCGDSTNRAGSKTGPKRQGYRQREMTLRPDVVFTGRKLLHLKSKYQLLPAQACQDSQEDDEDEETSESEMVQCRRTTLKWGRKTIEEKQEEKGKQEAAENQRLFGDPENDPASQGPRPKHKSPSIYKKTQKPVSTPQKVTTRRQVAKDNSQMTVKGEDCKKQMLEDTSDTTSAPDGQPDILDEEEADNSVDSSCFSGTLQRTFDPEQTAVHGMDGHAENCSGSACSKSQLRRKARMSLWNTEDKLAISQPLLDVDKKMEPPDLSIDALEEDLAPPPIKTSRVHQKPVRGLQQPSVAFFDRTYFQRFQLCCLPAYVGEGSLFVMDCSRMTPNCPKMLAHLQKQQEKLQHKKKTVICSTVLRGDLPSSSPASTCSSDMSDGRTHLIPSPTESSCTNFQFCAVDDGGHATSC